MLVVIRPEQIAAPEKPREGPRSRGQRAVDQGLDQEDWLPAWAFARRSASLVPCRGLGMDRGPADRDAAGTDHREPHQQNAPGAQRGINKMSSNLGNDWVRSVTTSVAR